MTSGEAEPRAPCVRRCPVSPCDHNGRRGRDINSVALTEHLLGYRPPPRPPSTNPPAPRSGVLGHGTFLPDADARRPDWPVHTAPPVAPGPQTAGGGGGAERHEREQVELKLTGSTEQLNVSGRGQDFFIVFARLPAASSHGGVRLNTRPRLRSLSNGFRHLESSSFFEMVLSKELIRL